MVRKERRRDAPNPMIQKVKGAPGQRLLRPGCLRCCRAQLGHRRVPSPAVLPQTRRCTRERPDYAASSSEDEDPAKEIGVTYKSTRSAVRTGSGASAGSSGGTGDPIPLLTVTICHSKHGIGHSYQCTSLSPLNSQAPCVGFILIVLPSTGGHQSWPFPLKVRIKTPAWHWTCPTPHRFFRRGSSCIRFAQLLCLCFSVSDHLWLLPREAAFALPNLLQRMGGDGRRWQLWDSTSFWHPSWICI